MASIITLALSRDRIRFLKILFCKIDAGSFSPPYILFKRSISDFNNSYSTKKSLFYWLKLAD